MRVTRREMLARSAAVAALPQVRTGTAQGTAAPGPAAGRPICIFSKHLQPLDYATMAAVAAELGFDGVDLTVRPGGHVLPERVEEDLPRAVEAVRRAGLAVPMMTTAIQGPTEAHTERVLKTAAALGIKAYRLGWIPYRRELGIAGSLDALRPVLRDLAAMNRQFGIHGGYQNHAGTNVGAPVWDLWLLLRDLDPQWLGAQYDIRHAVVEGGTSWPLGMRLLAAHVRTTVIKDFHWGRSEKGRWDVVNVPLREGMVDFDTYFALVKELAIAGPISLHLEYAPIEGGERESAATRKQQVVPPMKRDLATLRRMLASAGL